MICQENLIIQRMPGLPVMFSFMCFYDLEAVACSKNMFVVILLIFNTSFMLLVAGYHQSVL